MKRTLLYLVTLEIYSGKISKVDGRIAVDDDLESALLVAGKAWRKGIKLLFDIDISNQNSYADETVTLQADFSTRDKQPQMKLFDYDSIETTIERFKDEYRATIELFSNAFKLGCTFTKKTKLQLAILELNVAIWNLQKFGATCKAFPDSKFPWYISAVDPAGLRVNIVNEDIASYVDRAVLLGVYICGDYNQGIFNTGMDVMVDVVLRIDNENCEIRTRMTLEEAQSIWKGYKKISCNIVTKSNGISDVVGNLIII